MQSFSPAKLIVCGEFFTVSQRGATADFRQHNITELRSNVRSDEAREMLHRLMHDANGHLQDITWTHLVINGAARRLVAYDNRHQPSATEVLIVHWMHVGYVGSGVTDTSNVVNLLMGTDQRLSLSILEQGDRNFVSPDRWRSELTFERDQEPQS